MAFYRTYRANSRKYAASSAGRGKRATGPGFAASPAGKHRLLAMNAFKIARAARAAGNWAHFRRMVAFGKRALALSKAEYRLWKRGFGLRAKAFAAHQAVAARRPGTARRSPGPRPARFAIR